MIQWYVIKLYLIVIQINYVKFLLHFIQSLNEYKYIQVTKFKIDGDILTDSNFTFKKHENFTDSNFTLKSMKIYVVYS